MSEQQEREVGGRRQVLTDRGWVEAPAATAVSYMEAHAALDAKTVKDLNAIAKQLGMTGYSKLTKPDLIGRILAQQGIAP